MYGNNVVFKIVTVDRAKMMPIRHVSSHETVVGENAGLRWILEQGIMIILLIFLTATYSHYILFHYHDALRNWDFTFFYFVSLLSVF